MGHIEKARLQELYDQELVFIRLNDAEIVKEQPPFAFALILSGLVLFVFPEFGPTYCALS